MSVKFGSWSRFIPSKLDNVINNETVSEKCEHWYIQFINNLFWNKRWCLTAKTCQWYLRIYDNTNMSMLQLWPTIHSSNGTPSISAYFHRGNLYSPGLSVQRFRWCWASAMANDLLAMTLDRHIKATFW